MDRKNDVTNTHSKEEVSRLLQLLDKMGRRIAVDGNKTPNEIKRCEELSETLGVEMRVAAKTQPEALADFLSVDLLKDAKGQIRRTPSGDVAGYEYDGDKHPDPGLRRNIRAKQGLNKDNCSFNLSK